MAITLAQAKEQLTKSLAALEKARRATSYSISDRSKQTDGVAALQRQVALWEKRVDELSATAARSPGMIFPRWR